MYQEAKVSRKWGKRGGRVLEGNGELRGRAVIGVGERKKEWKGVCS